MGGKRRLTQDEYIYADGFIHSPRGQQILETSKLMRLTWRLINCSVSLSCLSWGLILTIFSNTAHLGQHGIESSSYGAKIVCRPWVSRSQQFQADPSREEGTRGEREARHNNESLHGTATISNDVQELPVWKELNCLKRGSFSKGIKLIRGAKALWQQAMKS